MMLENCTVWQLLATVNIYFNLNAYDVWWLPDKQIKATFNETQHLLQSQHMFEGMLINFKVSGSRMKTWTYILLIFM
jgi:hypothetical protein